MLLTSTTHESIREYTPRHKTLLQQRLKHREREREAAGAGDKNKPWKGWLHKST